MRYRKWHCPEVRREEPNLAEVGSRGLLGAVPGSLVCRGRQR